MLNLTPAQRAERLDRDEASIKSIMGPDSAAQMVGLMVTAYIRGLELRVDWMVRPWKMIGNLRDAYAYGQDLGGRFHL